MVADRVVVGAANAYIDQYAVYAESFQLSNYFDATLESKDKSSNSFFKIPTSVIPGLKLNSLESDLARHWNTLKSAFNLKLAFELI